eukprot:3556689-Rhodomonas_salina.2
MCWVRVARTRTKPLSLTLKYSSEGFRDVNSSCSKSQPSTPNPSSCSGGSLVPPDAASVLDYEAAWYHQMQSNAAPVPDNEAAWYQFALDNMQWYTHTGLSAPDTA